MTRYFLRGVSVEGFRGINNEGAPLSLTFKPDRVNSVFAPNGTGKSSLFEALEYAFKGRVGRLSQMQAGERPDEYVTNLFHSQRAATIEITLEPDDGGACVAIKVERDSSGNRKVSSTDVDDPEALLASMNHEFSLLDYRAFNRFIEESELERGRSFSSLLGLSQYGAFLRTIKTLAHGQTFKSDFEINRLGEAREGYRRQANGALRDFATHYRIVTAQDVQDLSAMDLRGAEIIQSLRGAALLEPALADATDLRETDFDQVRKVLFEVERGDLREKHTRVLAAHTALEASLAGRRSEEVAKPLRDALADYRAALLAAEEAELEGLLTAASDYLHRDHPPVKPATYCPLCERDGAENLIENVDRRLNALEDLRGKERALRGEVASGSFTERLAELENHEYIPDDCQGSVSEQLRDAVAGKISLTDEMVAKAQSRLEILEDRLDAELRRVRGEIADLEATLPPSLMQLAQLVSAAEAARSELIRYTDASIAAERLGKTLETYNEWKSFLDYACQAFAAAESDMTQRVLGELRSDYQTIFRGIMGTAKIVPALKRTVGNEKLSVELAEFHSEKSVSARAVLSESYRNALAISVFLAAASKHGQAPRFVVLDDVTSSFDSGHQFGLMEQLRSRLQYNGTNEGLQIVLLSHDNTLEKYFDRLHSEADWHHQKLHGFPPETQVSTTNQSHSRLRDDAATHLAAGQVDLGASLIRQYMEYVLLDIIRKLRIPVPIDLAVNDHQRMVANCLNAIDSAVRLHKAVGDLVLEPEQVENLTGGLAGAIVGNFVSHYSTGAAAFGPQALLNVLDDIDAYRRCFQYEESGALRYYKSLTRRN